MFQFPISKVINPREICRTYSMNSRNPAVNDLNAIGNLDYLLPVIDLQHNHTTNEKALRYSLMEINFAET